MPTDNSNRSAKKNLRRYATRCLSTLRVLDCYAGNGAMWANVSKELYLGIEKQRGKGSATNGIVNADNLKMIPNMDLSAYNVIDLDAYGVPYDQMRLIFENKTLQHGTVVIYTAIRNGMSGVNANALENLGLSKMYKKCPSLFKPMYMDCFYELLRSKGVSKVHEIDQSTKKKGSYEKHYGFFVY